MGANDVRGRRESGGPGSVTRAEFVRGAIVAGLGLLALGPRTAAAETVDRLGQHTGGGAFEGLVSVGGKTFGYVGGELQRGVSRVRGVWRHFDEGDGHMTAGLARHEGTSFVSDAEGRLWDPGWHVSGELTGGGLERYYVEDKTRSIPNGYSKSGWPHANTTKGYVARGVVGAGDGTVWLADNDGRLLPDGWSVTDRLGSKGQLQRYYVDPETHRAPKEGPFRAKVPTGGGAREPWDDTMAFRMRGGYVLRGRLVADGRSYRASNDGSLMADGWHVSDFQDRGYLQRFYVDPAHHGIPLGHFTVGKDHFYSIEGSDKDYVLRGKLRVGAGMLLADNEGKLAWSEGWLVSGAYDGGELQRYRIDGAPGGGLMGAHLGEFTVDGASYVGRYDTGYVVRGTYVQDNVRYECDNDGRIIRKGPAAIGDPWVADTAYMSGIEAQAASVGSPTDWFVRIDCSLLRCVFCHREDGGWHAKAGFNADLGHLNADGRTSTGLFAQPTVVDVDHKTRWTPEGRQYFTSFIENWIGDYDDSQGFHDGYVKDPPEYISAGCPRLTTERAKWVYDTIPIGTNVLIAY